MKKTLLAFASLVIAVTSCMKGTTYQASGVVVDDGNYNNASELFKDGATAYLFEVPEGSTSGEAAFMTFNTYVYFSKTTATSLLGGFALSRQAWEKPEPDDGSSEEETTPEDPAVPGEYSVYGTSNAQNPNTFLYFRQTSVMPEHDIAFASPTVGTCTPIGVYVCNSAATVRAIKGENVDDSEFRLNGDYILTATGFLNGAKTGTATFLLAGKGKRTPTEDNPSADSLTTSWSLFDLGKLGNIDYIDFDLSFSDPSDNALLQYTDVCFDNLGSTVYISY